MDAWTSNVIASRPERIGLHELEQRFGMKNAEALDIAQRALDSGLLLASGDGAPGQNAGLWADAYRDGETVYALTREDYQRYCAAQNRAA